MRRDLLPDVRHLRDVDGWIRAREVDKLLGRRTIHPRVEKCILSLVEVVQKAIWYLELAIELNGLDEALNCFMLSQHSIGRLQAHAADTREVVTAAQDGHPSKVGITPACEADFPTRREMAPIDLDALAVLVELRNQAFRAKDQQIRIL